MPEYSPTNWMNQFRKYCGKLSLCFSYQDLVVYLTKWWPIFSFLECLYWGSRMYIIVYLFNKTMVRKHNKKDLSSGMSTHIRLLWKQLITADVLLGLIKKFCIYFLTTYLTILSGCTISKGKGKKKIWS